MTPQIALHPARATPLNQICQISGALKKPQLAPRLARADYLLDRPVYSTGLVPVPPQAHSDECIHPSTCTLGCPDSHCCSASHCKGRCFHECSEEKKQQACTCKGSCQIIHMTSQARTSCRAQGRASASAWCLSRSGASSAWRASRRTSFLLTCACMAAIRPCITPHTHLAPVPALPPSRAALRLRQGVLERAQHFLGPYGPY